MLVWPLQMRPDDDDFEELRADLERMASRADYER